MDLRDYRDDPVQFHEKVLGRKLWSKQVEVCEAIARNPITVVPAGRAVGKSYLLAGVVLWWLFSRPMSLVITTGPDHRQVVSVLWKEIRRALRCSRLPLKFQHLTDGFGSPQRLSVQNGSEWCALGFAARTEEGFSGQHAADLLVVVDEASGITQPIWSAIHGLAASRLVVVGNPIRYDCHFRELYELSVSGSPTIGHVSISSLESPDAANPQSSVGMASGAFLSQMAEIHGENSPWWHSNILGKFPGQESTRFLPAAWLDSCLDEGILHDPQWVDYPAGNPWIGVDIGGGVGADRSAVVVRDRKRLLEVFVSDRHGVLDDAGERLEPIVARLASKWKVPGARVIFDQGGIGRSFASYLAHHGLEGAIGYFGAGRGGHLHLNRRTANAYAFKKRLDPHREGYVPFYCGGIPEWPALRNELAELQAPRMELEEGQIKQRLEDKSELAARLHRSPDLMDAFLMTFTFSD
jgi:hypothetical protein